MAAQVIARRAGIVAAASVAVVLGVAAPASAHHPASWFKNCTAVHKHWPHGIGKRHAHDHTTGTPVTNFKHKTKLYKHAMTINSGLDADKDGIACEEA